MIAPGRQPNLEPPFGEARNKVTGAASFAFDSVLPHMLHGKLLRSPLPHARIRAIDSAAAEAMPGVACVVTGADTAVLRGPVLRSGATRPAGHCDGSRALCR